MRHVLLAIAGTIAIACPLSAGAQTFPAAGVYVPFRCGDAAMNDPVGDHTVAVRERDVVGTNDAPAGLRASDGDFLYLKLRVDDDPRMGQGLRAFAWGFAFGLSADGSRYETLVTVDGAADRVVVSRNTATTTPGAPDDPADAPPVATYAFSTHGRVEEADTSLGGTRDHFITMAVRWTDLGNAGLTAGVSSIAWAGSSTLPDRLDGDLACHAAGGARVPTLAESGTRPQPVDPGAGAAAGGVSFEGGPGCAVLPRSHVAGAWPGWALALAALASRRRRR